MRFTCGECPDSVFVLCFTWFEALPADAIHLHGVSGFSICVLHGLRLCEVMRFTCRGCQGSAFVILCFTCLETLPGDAMHLQGVSGFSIYIHVGPPCTTMRPRIVRGYPGVTMSAVQRIPCSHQFLKQLVPSSWPMETIGLPSRSSIVHIEI